MLKKFFFSFLLGLLLLAPSAAFAQFGGLDDSQGNLEDVAEVASISTDGNDLPTIIGGFIRVALSFLGLIFLILVIYAGFLWMTAGGSDEQVGKAKTLVGQAVVGLIIVIASFAISEFVIDAVSNATGNSF